jgi:hypothetical protein
MLWMLRPEGLPSHPAAVGLASWREGAALMVKVARAPVIDAHLKLGGTVGLDSEHS